MKILWFSCEKTKLYLRLTSLLNCKVPLLFLPKYLNDKSASLHGKQNISSLRLAKQTLIDENFLSDWTPYHEK